MRSMVCWSKKPWVAVSRLDATPGRECKSFLESFDILNVKDQIRDYIKKIKGIVPCLGMFQLDGHQRYFGNIFYALLLLMLRT